MSLTREQARDEILTVLKTAWDAGVESAGVPIYYQNTEGDPANTQITGTTDPSSWARATLLHNIRRQGALSAATGHILYEIEGILTIQLFTPHGDGLLKSDKLSKIVEDAFDGVKTPSGVWFKNVRSNEVGPSGAWFQTNVVVEFNYDEIK